MGFLTKDDVPPAPDMSGVINAAKEVTATASDIAKQTQDWATNAVADNKADIGKYTDQLVSDSDTARGMVDDFQNIANKQIGLADGAADIKEAAMTDAAKQGAVEDTQLGVQKQQLDQQNVQLQFQKDLQKISQDFRGDQQAIQQKADELYQQYQQTYPALAKQFAADAANYDTPERRAQAGAEATAGVGMQFQAARDAATRQLESFGIKPSDTRFAALDLGTRIKEAAAKASADRAAQLATEDKGFQLRDEAIKQGSVLPGQSTAETNAATSAGSLVNAADSAATAQGNAAANYGSLANQAGANAIGAGNASTAALNTATGATNAGTGALTGATQANTGALAADTAGATITGAAGDLANKGLSTETTAAGASAPFINAATSGVNSQTAADKANYDNQMAQFKAESTNTSGLGALLGTVAGPLIKAGLGAATGGASLPFGDGWRSGGTASNITDSLSASDSSGETQSPV